jgi:HlyD family secretion protein
VVIELIDKSSLEVVLSVDEVDIGRLQIGQPALITLEAWQEVEMESELLRIAPQANSSTSGITSYDVYLSLPATELPLLLGMTANAQLITAELDEVLLVPNAAIAADRAANQYSVTRVLGETTETVIVGIGLQDENYTQITSGLNAGDQLLIGNVLPVFQFGPEQ